MRIAAAQALANLDAVEHVAEIEAALANAPAEETERQLYEVELRRALEHLAQSR